MKKITTYFFIAGFGFILFSCASSIPRADALHEEWAQKRWPNIHLTEARKIYAANCSGCHSLHSPAEHTQKEWVVLFDEMAWKAHMVSSDSVQVLAYLETFSKDNNLQMK
jgi:hypothetical protein